MVRLTVFTFTALNTKKVTFGTKILLALRYDIFIFHEKKTP